MLNLLRFREWADYSAVPKLAPIEPISGSAAYDRYVRHTIPFLTASGGSVEFFGTGGPFFVGPEDERWDLVRLIRQSRVNDFFAFASNGGYLAGVGHRTAALEDSRLLPIVDRAMPESNARQLLVAGNNRSKCRLVRGVAGRAPSGQISRYHADGSLVAFAGKRIARFSAVTPDPQHRHALQLSGRLDSTVIRGVIGRARAAPASGRVEDPLKTRSRGKEQ
jgi:hypothetical protein